MNTLLQYSGVILILLVVVLLALTFFVLDLPIETNNVIYGVSFLLILAGVVLCIIGGKKTNRVD